MATLSQAQLLDLLDASINTNGRRAITGSIENEVLRQIILNCYNSGSENIGNTNLDMSGIRVLNFNGFKLSFTNASQLKLNAGGVAPPSGNGTFDITGSGTTGSTRNFVSRNGAGSVAAEIYDDLGARFNGPVAFGTSPETGVALKMAGATGTGVQVFMSSGRAGVFQTSTALCLQVNNTAGSGIGIQSEADYPIVGYGNDGGIVFQAIHTPSAGYSSKFAGINLRGSFSKSALPSTSAPGGYVAWITVHNAGAGNNERTLCFWDGSSWCDIRTQTTVI